MATAAARVGDLLGDLSASTSPARKRSAEPSFEASLAKRRSGVSKAVSSLDFEAFQVLIQSNGNGIDTVVFVGSRGHLQLQLVVSV